MKKKLKLVVLVGCLLILVNLGIAGTSLADDPQYVPGRQGEPVLPVVLAHHADANGPYSGDVDEVISFSGLGTWMSTTGGIFYEWDFDDGTTGYGKYPTHAYSKSGVYYVTLTATNGIGDVYKDIAPVYIKRMADHLTPIGGCHYHGDVDETITFDASDSESTGAEIVQYFWNFGDGESAVGEQVTHSYDEERVYMVTLDVKDSNGFTRHDVLHADIGRSYSDEDDFFHNSPSGLEDVLDFLLNRNNFVTKIFCSLLNAKIYTNFNGFEQTIAYSGGELEIDVNNGGAKDVKVNDLKFFKARKTTSMFDEHSRVWYQFETTLSHITKISSEITANDDFTISLQLDFGIIADRLDLDDTIMRVGYNSPSGQEMPDDIELVHIIRPYLLFRMFSFLNNQNVECGQAQGVSTAVVYNTLATAVPMGVPGREPIDEGGDTSGSGDETIAPIVSPESEELEGYAQPGSQQAQPAGDGNSEYWPEYGLELRNTGGGSFSVMTEFINLAGSSKTTAKISTDASSTSTFMYKRTKDGGILNHATIFEISGDSATFEAVRNKNGVVTELSTGFSFSTKLFRGMEWSDSGVYFGVLGDTEASLNNFYFNNPGTTLNIGEISLDTHGSFNFLLNQEEGAKVDLDGSLGFGISDLYFDSTDLDVNIIGDFAMEVTSPAHFALGAGVLEAGFTGTLGLYTNAIFEVNGQTIGVGGDFELDANGIIKFTWGSNEFNINLEAGGELDITDLHFEVGDLNASAYKIGIEADGQFDIFWVNQEVTINGGSGASLYLRDVNITINNRNSLYIRIIGDLTIEADGEITFGPDVFKAEFSGLLDLGTSVEFEINGESIIVGGKFDFDTGNGEIIFSWENGDFSLDVSSNLELSIDNLYFEIGFDTGDLIVISELVEIGLNGEFNVVSDNGEVTISGDADASLGIQDLTVSLTIGNPDLTIQIIGWFEVEANGWVTFGSGVFKTGFDGTLDLGTATQFVINGEGVTAGGVFYMTGINNEMSFLWDDEGFTINVGGNTDLSVVNFYFEVDDVDLIVTADGIGIGISGQILIDWDSVNEEITISSGSSSVSFSLVNLYVDYADVITVEIIGSFNVEANGYLKFGPNLFEVSFSGTLDLGVSTQFIINGDGITVGGQFALSIGDGTISFSWSDTQLTLDFSGSSTLTVTNFYFEAGDLTITGDEVEIEVSGQFDVSLDTANNEVTISSGTSGISLYIENVEITYGTTLNVEIIGSFELEANGWLTFGDGVFEAGFSGTLDLGVSTQFIINGDGITVGGQFALSSGNGQIGFTWDSATKEFSLYVSGSPSVSVSNLYFEAGDITVEAVNVEIGANGEFNLDWDTTTNEVTFSSGGGVSLEIEDVSFVYGTTIDASITGSLDIQAEGDITLAPGALDTIFSGTLDFGTSCVFEINGNSLTVGGQFALSIGDGTISFSWSDTQLTLDFSGSSTLTVTNFYFEAGDLTITGDEVEIEVSGQFDVSLDTANNEVTISSGTSGISLYIENVEITYGTTLNVEIIGSFELEANGWLTFGDGVFEAGFSGTLDLGVSTQFIINGDGITVGGQFDLGIDNGEISFTWADDTFSLSVSGGVALQAYNLYFEAEISSETLIVEAYEIAIGADGDLTIDWDNGDDEVSISTSGLLIVTNLQVEYGDLSISTNIDIQGDGDFSATYSDNNLDVSIDAAFTWYIWLNSALIGEWEAEGELSGNLDIEAEWSIGIGYVFVDIIEEGILNLLDITHDDLNLNLVDILLPVGTVKFEWFRDSAEQEGYFLIDSELNENICTANLATITWGTKSVSVGWPCIKPGDFKFEWDIPDRFLRFRNGIENLSPTFTFADSSQNFELFVSSGSLPHDYSKQINFIWYLINNQISGILIDTEGTYLTELIELGFIKGSSGRKLAVYGIECDNFYIGTDPSGNLEWEGHIYIANHVIYSKLVSNDWKDLDVQWNFQGDEKWLIFQRDPAFDFTLELDLITIGNFEFSAEFDFFNTEYFEIRWDIGSSGSIYLDTDWQPFSTITFEILHVSSGNKIEIYSESIKAQNWMVQWTAWPPEEWNLQFSGSLQIYCIDIWITLNGDRRYLPI